MNHLRRISGSIWGPKLKTMKQLYVTKILPIITYACGAWFMHGHKGLKWGLTKKRLGILESLQYQCLLQISGAMKGTARIVLEKELNIDSIQVTLGRLAATHRAKMFGTPDHNALVECRTKPGEADDDRDHPYVVLDEAARRLKERTWQGMVAEHGKAKASMKWRQPEVRNKTLGDYSKGDAFRESEAIWDEYRRKRAQKHATVSPAMKERWGAETFLKCYSNLPRAQTTILLQCRTEVIGLNNYLFSKEVCGLESSIRPSCGLCF